jgi:hypothetical protein
MALSVNHKKVATAPDDTSDPTKVLQADWNDTHDIIGFGDAAEKNVGTIAGTVAEGNHNHDGIYEIAGTSASNMGTHEGNSDPHLGYLNTTRADALYTPLSHNSDTNNPHSVTKSQVGLSDVDNISASNLRDRSTHTGEQASSTITNFNLEVDSLIADGMLDHVGLSDPHTQYLTEIDAATAYANINHIHETGNLVIVSKTPSDNEYSSVSAAIDDIKNNRTRFPDIASSTKRYLIQVRPGEFIEPPMSIPAFVYVSGNDPWNSAIIKTNDVNSNFITLEANSGLFNIAVSGPTLATKSAIIQTTSGTTKIYWVNIKEGSYGVTLAPVSGVARCHCIGVVTDGPTVMNRLFNCDNPVGAGVFILMQSGPMVTTWTGSDPSAIYVKSNGASPPRASATIDLCQFRGNAPSGQILSSIYADNGALVRGISTSFAGATSLTNQAIAIRIGSTDTGSYKTKVDMHGSQIKPGGHTYDIKIDSPTAICSFSGVATESTISVATGAVFVANFSDTSSGKLGQVILGELWIGDKNVQTPLASYIQADKNTGIIEGGELSRGRASQVIDIGGLATGATATGLTNDATVYTANITLDGTLKVVSIIGSDAQTITALLSEINTDLSTSGVAELYNGNIRISSNYHGIESSLSISDIDLFSNISGFISITQKTQLEVLVNAGSAFIDTPTGLKLIRWNQSYVDCPNAEEKIRIYVNSNSTILTSNVGIDKTANIQLGEVGTNSYDIRYLFDLSVRLPQFRPKLYEYFEKVIGPINISGGIVSVNATNQLGLDVTDSEFFVTEEELFTTGGTEIEMIIWHRDGAGGWNSTKSTSLDNLTYDDGSGVLATMFDGKYRRDVILAGVNYGGTEYHVVIGQEQFDSVVESINNPVIPTTISEHACRLAAIIIQKASPTIDSILDQRPRIGQQAAASSGIINHNDMVGRDSVNAHSQYQLVSEKNNPNGYVGLDGSSKIDSTFLQLSELAPSDVSASTGSAGVSNTISKSDHKHNISVGTPISIGSSNNSGSESSLSRSDHTHSHGNQVGGLLHSDVIASGASGFMSGSDKNKLDNITFSGLTKITVGITEPISPSIGDLWIDTN